MDRCEYCGALFEQNGQGRPRQYCKQSHANHASVIRCAPLEAILRQRPDLRKLVRGNADR
jgi:hypothetical protein